MKIWCQQLCTKLPAEHNIDTQKRCFCVSHKTLLCFIYYVYLMWTDTSQYYYYALIPF